MPASIDETKGTWSHMAPELLFPEKFGRLDGRVSKEADIYAFGMVVYEVLTGHIPFAGEGRWFAEIIMRVMEGNRPRKPENADRIGFGKGTWELVQRCWDENRDRRPTVQDISKHFQHIAKTSKIVPPGQATLVRDVMRPAPVFKPDSSSENFSKHLVSRMPNQISLFDSPTVRPFVSNQDKHDSAAQVCRRSYGC